MSDPTIPKLQSPVPPFVPETEERKLFNINASKTFEDSKMLGEVQQAVPDTDTQVPAGTVTAEIPLVKESIKSSTTEQPVIPSLDVAQARKVDIFANAINDAYKPEIHVKNLEDLMSIFEPGK